MHPDNISIKPSVRAVLPWRGAGAGLFCFLVLLFALPSVIMLLGGRIGPWIFYAALLAALPSVPACAGKDRHCRLAAAVIYVALIVIALLIAAALPDFSFDGQGYHQYGVVALARGWNPWHDGPSVVFWTNHYAKGIEIMEAVIYSGTGSLEAAKGVNMLLQLSAALLFAAVIARQWGRDRLSPKSICILTLLMACNPVGITQLETFYIDYAKYYLWVITIVGSVWIYFSPSRREIMAGMALVADATLLAIAAKFNIAFEQALLLLAIIIWGAVNARGRRFSLRMLYASLAAAVLSVILCSHPYITNWLGSGHPLYPLMGEGSVDIMTIHTPTAVEGADRFSAFAISLFGSWTPACYDTALGGFGPAAGIIMILTLYAWIRYRKFIAPAITLLALFVLATCFLYPQAWWARYICQLWLLPVLIFTAIRFKARARRLTVAVALLALLNGGLLLGREMFESLRYAARQKALIEACAGEPLVMERVFPQHVVRATELGADQIEAYGPEYVPQNDGNIRVSWTKHNGVAPEVVLTAQQAERFETLCRNSLFNPPPYNSKQ